MKHRYLHTLLASLTALAIASCATDTLPQSQEGGSGGPLTLWAEIQQLAVTRVNDEGFADGDRMGVYVVDYEGDQPGTLRVNGNRANNVQHTLDAATGTWTPASPIYWKDKHTHVDIYSYYPMGHPQSIDLYPFNVQADQSQEVSEAGMGSYEASDFLWGKSADMAPTTSSIHMAMHHRMACVRVTLVMGEGFNAEGWASMEKSLQLTNLVRKSTIDLATGIVTPRGEPEKTATTPLHTGNEWRAIVVPQTVKAGTSMMDITLDGRPYRFARQEDFTFQPGRMSNFTIKVDRKIPTGSLTLTLLGESITPWENDPTSHDASTKAYIVVNSTEGHLQDSILARGLSPESIISLKVTGRVNNEDLDNINFTNMPLLRHLNLREVTLPNDSLNGIGEHAGITRIVLPEKLRVIGYGAFYGHPHLSGTLIIPEGVTTIYDDAFRWTQFSGELKLPSTLKYIGYYAFEGCQFSSELRLPSGLQYIGTAAFSGCTKLYGRLILPESLIRLGKEAFDYCPQLTGNIVIPQNIKEVPERCFANCKGLTGTLTLHDGIHTIGEYAFQNTPLTGELVMPRYLTSTIFLPFEGTKFSHIVIPEGTERILWGTFYGFENVADIIELPESVEYIDGSAFYGCSHISGFKLGKNVSTIGDRAFNACFGIRSFVCEASVPPTVGDNAFVGVPKDSFTLEVPEASVTAYQTAEGWREFKFISAHHELNCAPASASALNATQVETVQLRAEGQWSVESKPDWCTLSQTSGSGDTNLTLTITALPHGDGDREGDVIFRLDDKEYNCTFHVTQKDYAHPCDEWITLQQATKGHNGGVNIVLLGDGYDLDRITDGSYLEDMKTVSKWFFDIEPYKSYRQYFNVYTAIALSQGNGIGTPNTPIATRFGTTYNGTSGLTANTDEIFRYALGAPTVDAGNLCRTLIIVVPNTTEYEGVTQMWSDGSAISFCPRSERSYPYDVRGVIQHEAGGHGFGKLADEGIYHNTFITACNCQCCQHAAELTEGQQLGWYSNVSLTAKTHDVPWSLLLDDPTYNNVVDVYEGGFGHMHGVFRSEQNSCMNNSIPYFNAISRLSIVRRIKEYAGEEFTYEDFKAHDVLNAGSVTRSAGATLTTGTHGLLPVIHRGSPHPGAQRTQPQGIKHQTMKR